MEAYRDNEQDSKKEHLGQLNASIEELKRLLANNRTACKQLVAYQERVRCMQLATPQLATPHRMVLRGPSAQTTISRRKRELIQDDGTTGPDGLVYFKVHGALERKVFVRKLMRNGKRVPVPTPARDTYLIRFLYFSFMFI